MDINKLLIETSNNINELLSLKSRSKRSIISDNLSNIETLSKNGVSYRQLLESGRIPLSLKHFHDLIYSAQKKRTDTKSKISTINLEQKKVTPVKASSLVSLKKENINIVEWKMIMPDISEFLVRDIVEEGYSIQDVEKWISANQLPNSSALRRFFSSLKTKNK